MTVQRPASPNDRTAAGGAEELDIRTDVLDDPWSYAQRRRHHIAELAATTALGTATLRAGRDGLDRTARRVQWMEVLDDYADYLAEGDLLLTTAYNLRDDAELQRELARRLVECGVAAMVVKCGYYLEQVPHVVRRQADRHGLPVFELPREVAFVEISQSIYERLVSRSYARLRRSADIHRELVRLAAEGARLPRIVRRAAALLGNPVLVEDARGRPLAGFLPSGEPLADPRPDAALAAQSSPGAMLHGRVLLFGERAPADDDAQALEQVATVVALEITRSDRELRAERERLAAFVRDLVGGVLTPEDAQREAAVLGVELPPAPAVAVLEGRRNLTGLDLVRHEAGRTVAVVPAGSQLDAQAASPPARTAWPACPARWPAPNGHGGSAPPSPARAGCIATRMSRPTTRWSGIYAARSSTGCATARWRRCRRRSGRRWRRMCAAAAASPAPRRRCTCTATPCATACAGWSSSPGSICAAPRIACCASWCCWRSGSRPRQG